MKGLILLIVVALAVIWLIDHSQQLLNAAIVILVLVVLATMFFGRWFTDPFGFLMRGAAGSARLGTSMLGGRSRGPGLMPVLLFRVQTGAREVEVLLSGHDSGVYFGHEVSVVGLSIGGRIRALRVVNRTTGATLRRPGTWRLALGVTLIVLLIAAGLLSSGK